MIKSCLKSLHTFSTIRIACPRARSGDVAYAITILSCRRRVKRCPKDGTTVSCANTRSWRNQAKTERWIRHCSCSCSSSVDRLEPQHHMDVTFSATSTLCEFCKPAKPAQHYTIMKLLKRESKGSAEWRKQSRRPRPAASPRGELQDGEK